MREFHDTDLLYGNLWERMTTALALRQERIRRAQTDYEGSGPGRARKLAYEARRPNRQGAEYYREYRAANRERINAQRRALRNSRNRVKVTV